MRASAASTTSSTASAARRAAHRATGPRSVSWAAADAKRCDSGTVGRRAVGSASPRRWGGGGGGAGPLELFGQEIALASQVGLCPFLLAAAAVERCALAVQTRRARQRAAFRSADRPRSARRWPRRARPPTASRSATAASRSGTTASRWVTGASRSAAAASRSSRTASSFATAASRVDVAARHSARASSLRLTCSCSRAISCPLFLDRRAGGRGGRAPLWGAGRFRRRRGAPRRRSGGWGEGGRAAPRAAAGLRPARTGLQRLGRGKDDRDIRGNGQLDLIGAAALRGVGERRRPWGSVLGIPRLVLEFGKHPRRGAVPDERQSRAHEPPPAYSGPPSGDDDTVVGERHVVRLECDLLGRGCRLGRMRHRAVGYPKTAGLARRSVRPGPAAQAADSGRRLRRQASAGASARRVTSCAHRCSGAAPRA